MLLYCEELVGEKKPQTITLFHLIGKLYFSNSYFFVLVNYLTVLSEGLVVFFTMGPWHFPWSQTFIGVNHWFVRSLALQMNISILQITSSLHIHGDKFQSNHFSFSCFWRKIQFFYPCWNKVVGNAGRNGQAHPASSPWIVVGRSLKEGKVPYNVWKRDQKFGQMGHSFY